MNRLLLKLRSLGQHLVSRSLVSDSSMSSIEEYYTLDIASTRFNPTYVNGTPLNVTKRVKSGPGENCNSLDANLKFLLNIRGFKENPFIKNCISAVTASGDTEVLEELQAFFTRLSGFEAFRVGGKASGTAFYGVRPVGSDAPEITVNPTKGNMVQLQVYPDVVPIILTYQGVPLLQRPMIAAWWERYYQEPEPGQALGIDLVTGEKVYTTRLWSQPKVLDAPLVSFNSTAFEFEKYRQGDNYPISKATDDYISIGFEWVYRYDRNQRALLYKTSMTTELCWFTESSVDHPIFQILGKILKSGQGVTKEVVQAAWDDLAALDLSKDGTLMHFNINSRAESRFALIKLWSVPVSDLQRSLLRFQVEWAETGFVQVVPILTQGEGHSFIPILLYNTLLEAITTGGEYPEGICSNYYRRIGEYAANPKEEWVAKNALLWVTSYYSRKDQNCSMASNKHIFINPEEKQYSEGDSAPSLSPMIANQLVGLTEEQTQAFYYGILLSALGQCKYLYHLYKNKKAVKVENLPAAYGNPVSFGSKGIQNYRLYSEWLRNNGNSFVFQVCDTIFQEYLKRYRPNVFCLNSANRSTIGMSYLQTNYYWRSLASYHRQISALNEESNPSTEPNEGHPTTK